MNIVEFIRALEDNWQIVVFAFTLGGIWWQGTVWFRRVNTALEEANSHHNDQNEVLCDIRNKTENLERRIDKIEIIVSDIENHVRVQEVKLAVIDDRQRVSGKV